MLFHPIQTTFWKNINFDVIIDKTIIKKVYNYKYLGVIIDDNLNWSEHIKTLKNKLLKTIGVLYKTRYYLNEKSLFLIFNSLFISHIKYGLLCWGRANAGKINEIDKLINRALRCMYFKKWDESIKSIKITKKILNVKNMFKYDLGVFMYKFRRNMLPVNFKPYFTEINKIHKHLTRFSAENYFFQELIVFMALNPWLILVVGFGKKYQLI